MNKIDLRSDTVTQPDARMRQAMANAEVGDDVYGEDPTVERLQCSAAERLGYESSIFTPTGSMGNQIALQLHTTRGDDVILEAQSHVVLYELGGIAALAGALPRTVQGRRGCIAPEDLENAIAPETYYLAQARLLVLENTHNHAGGVVLPLDRQRALQTVAREHGLALHLDGARIFHAALAQGIEAAECASGFDTVMFCLSKGLGAPVGSLLCGSRDAIREARVLRKRMGGGMRQVGVLAAAGLCALENIPDLVADHERARRLATALAEGAPFVLDENTVETNIVVTGICEPYESA